MRPKILKIANSDLIDKVGIQTKIKHQTGNSYPKILTIAGSDSIGGAGIQADIKAITYFGGHATVAITAVTVQDLSGVYNIHYIPINILKEQIEVVMKNGVKSIKIGMLGNLEITTAVFEVLIKYPNIKIILDPVLIATSGGKLLTEDAVEIMKTKIFPISHIITPNIPEAEFLLGINIKSVENMLKAGKELLKLGKFAVLIKGGHLDKGDSIIDILLMPNGEVHYFKSDKINTLSTHGTGCALSSAIATLLAMDIPLEEAVSKAIDYVKEKIYMDASVFSN